MPELQLLRGIFQHNAALLKRWGDRVVVPPGDDMGQLRLRSRDLLVAVDQVVAGRHFDAGRTPVHLIGRKAVTRNLSDIAAMAAAPIACLAAVALPRNATDEFAASLFEAVRSTAEAHECPLIGGDIAVHARDDDPLTCAVTVLAEPAPGVDRAITRCGASAGDGVFVTGRLGGSLGADRLGRHLTFEPRLREAIELARRLGERLHAMIDLSDGLGRDLGHIAELSGVAVELDASAIPRTEGCDWRRAASDGEDYELAFCASGDVPDELLGLTITRIGSVGAANPSLPTVTIRDGATRFDATSLGWEHRGA